MSLDILRGLEIAFEKSETSQNLFFQVNMNQRGKKDRLNQNRTRPIKDKEDE